MEPSYIPGSRRLSSSYMEPFMEPLGYGGFGGYERENLHRSHPLQLYPVPIPYEDELVPVTTSQPMPRPTPVATAPVVTAPPIARPAP
eukprot:452448-Amphidinium_carterae.1